jgi:hypothetical protein
MVEIKQRRSQMHQVTSCPCMLSCAHQSTQRMSLSILTCALPIFRSTRNKFEQFEILDVRGDSRYKEDLWDGQIVSREII